MGHPRNENATIFITSCVILNGSKVHHTLHCEVVAYRLGVVEDFKDTNVGYIVLIFV